MVNSDYYVYLHIRNDSGEPFYVWKGRRARISDKGNRNFHWHNIVDKVGYSFEVLFENLTDEEACEYEINAISELRYFGYKLANYTNGGEGKSGYKTSDETKLKISIANKGKTVSEERRRNLSIAFKGRFVSEETRKKQSINNAFRRPDIKKKIAEANKKPVICSNGMKFDSATDAQKWAVENKLSKAMDGSSITACCTGRQKTACGFKWFYGTK